MPTTLRAAIEAELEGVSLRTLRSSAEALSAAYRAETPLVPKRSDHLQRLAYITVRMPATHAAAAAVLSEATRFAGPDEVRSLLDIGAGPGTMLWAAAGACPALERATLLDRDAELLALGKRLWARHERSGSMHVDWVPANAASGAGELPPADLVTLSYVLGELAPDERGALVERALRAARIALVIIEPGTPRGYHVVIDARTTLVARGASIAAPCPHARPCPLTGSDWCHFGVRLERSRAHRHLKDAALAWEDEKYSFLVSTKREIQPAGARILRRPQVDKGRIALRLCTRDGIQDVDVTRREPDLWRAARGARWGDTWTTPEKSEVKSQKSEVNGPEFV